jgi:hypothetical protein
LIAVVRDGDAHRVGVRRDGDAGERKRYGELAERKGSTCMQRHFVSPGVVCCRRRPLWVELFEKILQDEKKLVT